MRIIYEKVRYKMKAEEFSKQLFENSDKDYGIFPPPTDAQEGLDILITHFLGENWYTTLSICNAQVNSEAIYEILRIYPNGEQEKERKRKKISNVIKSIKELFINN